MADLLDADYLIAMDTQNVSHLHQMASRETLNGKLYLLLDFAPPGFPQVVPDPIYDGKFERVYSLVEAGCHGLLDHIRAKHGL
jgi:protein-tyrosine phosphatase